MGNFERIDSREFHPRGASFALFTGLVIVACGVSGCLQPVSVDPGSGALDPAALSVRDDSGGRVTLPAVATGPVAVFATRRGTLNLDRGLESEITYVMTPGSGTWKSVGGDAASEDVTLVTAAQGRYRIVRATAAPAAGHEIAQDTAHIIVDREAPVIDLDSRLVRRDAREALEVAWSIVDALPLARVDVFYSDDAGSSWRRLRGRHVEKEARFIWPPPPAPRSHHWLRIVAEDRAGNSASAEFPIDPLELSLVRAERAAAAKEAKEAKSVGATPEPQAHAAPEPAPVVPDTQAIPDTARAESGSTSNDDAKVVVEADPPSDSRSDPPRAEITDSGPRALNFMNETFRGGASHYLFLSGEVQGIDDVEILALPEEEGAPLSIATVPASQKRVLWEIPRRSGSYRIELRWQSGGTGQRWRAPRPFTIDADAPALEWAETMPQWGADSVSFRWTTDEPSVIRVHLTRRAVSGSTTTGNVFAIASGAMSSSAEGYSRRVDTRDWEEGRWRIQAVAEDAVGNRSAPVSHEVVIDRTAPVITAVTWKPARAGTPLELTAQLREEPHSSYLRWQRSGAAPITRALHWRRAEETGAGEAGAATWRAVAEPLPEGTGDAELLVTDRAGNRASHALTLEVAAVSGSVPAIADDEEDAVTAASATAPGGADSELRRQLLLEFRAFQERWRRGEQGPLMPELRSDLLARLGRQLQASPQETALRRASARLHLLATQPDRPAALAVLERGLDLIDPRDEGGDHGAAQLLSDIAAIELDLGRLGPAKRHLGEAIERGGDSAVRRYNLGQIYVAEQSARLAEREFRRAVELDPALLEARRAWALAVRDLPAEDRARARAALDDWVRRGSLTVRDAEVLESLMTRPPR